MTILDITNNDEYNNILKYNKVLVIFSASFCKPCNDIYPYMQELSETYKDIIFIKVDVQKCEDIDDINSILSIPHFKFMNNTQEICSFTGANRCLIIESIEKLRLS
jgi:thiol-disulfide isomerase/thioredoxin